MKFVMLFFILIFSLSLGDTLDATTKQKILEVKKIDINSAVERKKINFYNNGEVEEIIINDNGVIKINRFKILNKEILDFLNNISLNAINSVKNDKIEYTKIYKNKKLKFDYNNKKISFDYYNGGRVLLGKKEGDLKFNNENRIINYQKIYFQNKFEIPENNLSIYEIRYKNNFFIITDYKNDYKNKEIRLLIDLISYPFFLRNDLEQQELSINEIEEKDLVSSILIEKIKFFDDFYYKYDLYKIDNENLNKLSYIPTGYLNQINLNESFFLLNKKYSLELINFINNLSKDEDKILEYTYKVKSLENIKENFNYGSNTMKVLFGNNIIENPTIYKIYNKSLNPIIIIKEKNDELSLLDEIENNIESEKKIQKEIMKSNYEDNKILEKNFFYNKGFSLLITEKNCCISKIDRNGTDIIFIHDISIINKNEDEMREIIRNLKYNWKFEGLDLTERKHHIKTYENLDIRDILEELKNIKSK